MASHSAYDPWTDVVELLEDLPLDDNPTDALPGTPEKEAVFQDRIRRGRSIFHPLDAKLPDKVGFAPVAGIRDGDTMRGLLLEHDGDGDYRPVEGQKRRPKLKPYSDGPGMEERRKRARERQQTPEAKKRDAARKRACRAFQRKQREEEKAAAACARRTSLYG
jgi:hypothetical protein